MIRFTISVATDFENCNDVVSVCQRGVLVFRCRPGLHHGADLAHSMAATINTGSIAPHNSLYQTNLIAFARAINSYCLTTR